MPESRRFEAMGALITGGASGIGLATARRILAEGGQVTLWDVDQAKLDAATAEFGARSHAKRVDVTDPAAVERAAKEAEASMGGVDVLVCSAGVAGVNALVVDYPLDEWKRVFNVNELDPGLQGNRISDCEEGSEESVGSVGFFHFAAQREL